MCGRGSQPPLHKPRGDVQDMAAGAVIAQLTGAPQLLLFSNPVPEVLATLARLELPDFIHTLSTDTSSIRFHLPRHRLKFELVEGEVQSLDFKGYRLLSRSDGAAAALPAALPPRLDNFVLLLPDSTSARPLVLVPDGHVSLDAASGCLRVTPRLEEADAALAHHAFSVHPHTRHLCAQTDESRLFLATLYATAACAAQLPALGCTAGEAAMALVRECAGNHPLSPPEARNLEAVAAAAGHTPALRMLCALRAADAAAVDFLYKAAPAPQLKWPAGEEAVYLCQQASTAAGAALAPPLRSQLRPFERRLVLGTGGDCALGARRSVDRCIDVSELPACFEECASQLTEMHKHVIDTSLLLCTANFAHSMVVPKETDVAPGMPNAPPDEPLPFNRAAVESGKISKDFLDDLQKSVNAYVHGELRRLKPNPGPQALERAQAALEQQLAAVCAAKAELGQQLLLQLSAVPATWQGAELEVMRSAGRVATVAQIDLVRLAYDPDVLPVRLCPVLLCSALPARSLPPLLLSGSRSHALSLSLSLCVPPSVALSIFIRLSFALSLSFLLCLSLSCSVFPSLALSLPVLLCLFLSLALFLSLTHKQGGGVQALNPFLSDRAADTLKSAAQDWQEMCVLEDKLQRCLKCCPGHGLGSADARIDVTMSKLFEELSNKRDFNRVEHPGWLVLEVRCTLPR